MAVGTRSFPGDIAVKTNVDYNDITAGGTGQGGGRFDYTGRRVVGVGVECDALRLR
jgi:xylose isomerase